MFLSLTLAGSFSVTTSIWTLKFSRKKGCVHLQHVGIAVAFLGVKKIKNSSWQMRQLFAYAANETTHRIVLVVVVFFFFLSLTVQVAMGFTAEIRR